MTRKPVTDEAIAADIKNYGAAVRSLSPAEYEELEQRWNVAELHDHNPPLKNGRRICKITSARV